MTEMVFDTPQTLGVWKSYEYIGPDHRFHPVRYEPGGGFAGGPFIWADDSLWSIDYPETPNSILFFLCSLNLMNLAPFDLRRAQVSFCLRGEGLDLKGARCYFWVHTPVPTSTRWHLVSRPLAVSDGGWKEPMTLTLSNEPDRWHQSFASDPAKAASLNQTLAVGLNFGFSFVGFSEKVTGKVALSGFRISLPDQPAGRFTADFGGRAGDWLTVSRKAGRQVAPLKSVLYQPTATAGALAYDVVYVEDDFIRFPHGVPFAYLLFVRARHAMAGRHLSGALVMIDQVSEGLALHGGSVHFFIEHTASGTIWLHRQPILQGCNTLILEPDEGRWQRLAGGLPLAAVLAGNAGYDYLGLMAVGMGEPPGGRYILIHFSITPSVAKE